MEFTDETADAEARLAMPFNDNMMKAAATLFSAGTVADTLRTMVEIAPETIEACDVAGLHLSGTNDIGMAIPAHPAVAAIDKLQQRTKNGPSLEALALGESVCIDDCATDDRWPQFCIGAAAVGIRSVLALPLSDSGFRGTLNLYARRPSAFGAMSHGRGKVLASLGSLAVATSRSLESQGRRADNLQVALKSRELIGQAEGILMQRNGITAADAFDILRRASQHRNVKLRLVAEELVESSVGPDAPPVPVSRQLTPSVKLAG